MSRFRLITLGIAAAALALGASGCAGGINSANPPGGPATTAPSTKIVIKSPTIGQTLHTPWVANGTVPASVTGGITVDALDDSGNTVCLREVPAASIASGAWKAPLSMAVPPRDALVTVRAYTLDSSGKPENVAKVAIDVSSFSTPSLVISSPACHAALSGATIDVTGTAKAPNGVAVVELRDATGAALVKADIAVTPGDGYTPWTASLAVPAGLAAGLYDLVAYDTGADGTKVLDEFYVQLVKS
jgi:Bacterial Ig domain